MVTNASAWNAGGVKPGGGPCAKSSAGSRCSANTAPPPAMALTRMKERRERFLVTIPPLLGCAGARGLRRTVGGNRGGAMNRLANTQVSAAPADVASHGGGDLLVGRFRIAREQRVGRHHLARLAIA